MDDFLESLYKKYRKTNANVIVGAKRTGMSFINQQPVNTALVNSKSKLSVVINKALN